MNLLQELGSEYKTAVFISKVEESVVDSTAHCQALGRLHRALALWKQGSAGLHSAISLNRLPLNIQVNFYNFFIAFYPKRLNS